jgi:radical SAM protein with 4Fe4S-binding SPASM domain
MIIRKIKNLFGKYSLVQPKTYWIDIINVCNLKCVMCPQAHGLSRPSAVMDMDLFKRIVDQVCGNGPLLKLYLSGEPLMHKHLIEMIDYAGKSGCKTMIHTNATLLTEEMSRKLLATSLDFISFSFDGCTAEVYEKVRPPAKFHEVKSNIETFLRLRSEAGQKKPHAAVEIIRMKDTDPYIDDFVKHWERSGVDEVNVKPFMSWLGEVDDPEAIPPCNYGDKPCPALFTTSCFLTDGTVVPCCMDVDGKLPLGNITDSGFDGIWHGEKYDDLRVQHLSKSIAKGSICRGCYNTFCQTKKESLIKRLCDILGVNNRALARYKKKL